MRYSKLALLSTLSACALLTTTSSPAFAPSVTDLGLLRSQNMWHVSDINAKNTSYCAMVSQFDKEISLAFARSPSGSGSLAISFPSDILETGMEYQMTMQVDDLALRRYDVRATSTRSLIVQIGRDEEFYGSLGGNGTLRISLPTMDMQFDLAKFSSSYISLISCANKLPHHEGPRTAAMPVEPVEKTLLAGSVATAAADKPKTAPVTSATAAPAAPISLAAKTVTTPDSSAITEAKAGNQTLPGDIPHKDVADNPLAENIILKSKLSQMALEQTELTNNVNLLKSQKLDLQSKLDMKEKQYQLLEATISVKDRDLATVRSVSNNDSKTLADLQTQLSDIKRERDQTVADLQVKLADKNAQYDTLQKQFTDGAQARRTAQDKAMQAEAEMETLRQRLAQAQQQIAAADLQRSDLATQVQFQGQQSKTLLERVQAQLSKATQQVSLLESQLTSVAMQRDDLATQLDAEMNKNKALEARLEVTQRQVAYRSGGSAPVIAASAVPENNTNFAEEKPAPSHDGLPSIARDMMSLLRGPADAKAASSSAPAESWDTVIVQ